MLRRLRTTRKTCRVEFNCQPDYPYHHRFQAKLPPWHRLAVGCIADLQSASREPLNESLLIGAPPTANRSEILDEEIAEKLA